MIFMKIFNTYPALSRRANSIIFHNQVFSNKCTLIKHPSSITCVACGTTNPHPFASIMT